MKNEQNKNHWKPFVFAISAFAIILAMPSDVLAQYGLPQPAPSYSFLKNGQVYYQNPGGWSTGQYGQGGYLWDDRMLQKKLELTNSQRRELIDLKIDYDDMLGDMQLQMQKLSSNVYVVKEGGGHTVQKDVQLKIAELQKEMKNVASDFKKREKEVLLPHQTEQINRMQTTRKIAQGGFSNNLIAGGFDQQLSLTKEQKTRLVEKKKKLDKELNEIFIDFLEKSHKELLSELDSDQRDLAKQMLEDYEYKQKQAGLSLFSYEPYFMKEKDDK